MLHQFLVTGLPYHMALMIVSEGVSAEWLLKMEGLFLCLARTVHQLVALAPAELLDKLEMDELDYDPPNSKTTPLLCHVTGS